MMTEPTEQCEIIDVMYGAFKATVRWHGTIGKSRWQGLVGVGYGDTKDEAYKQAIEAAKASRLPKVGAA